MNDRKHHRWSALAATAVVPALLLACASRPPPNEELAVGRAAIDSARSAGAAESAPAELSSALNKLERARALVATGDYAQAQQMAEAAEADALVARAKAESVRSQRALTEVEASVRALREQATVAPPSAMPPAPGAAPSPGAPPPRTP